MNYFLYSMPRSGSNLVLSLLSKYFNKKLIGAFFKNEFGFDKNFKKINIKQSFEDKLDMIKNKNILFKIQSHHLEENQLLKIFNFYKPIFLFRKNFNKQLISYSYSKYFNNYENNNEYNICIIPNKEEYDDILHYRNVFNVVYEKYKNFSDFNIIYYEDIENNYLNLFKIMNLDINYININYYNEYLNSKKLIKNKYVF